MMQTHRLPHCIRNVSMLIIQVETGLWAAKVLTEVLVEGPLDP